MEIDQHDKYMQEAEVIWENFSDGIKYENRFFVKQNILDILERITRYCGVSPFGDLEVVRARIGDFTKKDDKEMKAPPKGRASDGRGNPRGISYFYTATNIETAIAEIRPYKSSKVTVATFISNKCFSLIDFRAIDIHEANSYAPLPLELLDRCILKLILNKLKQPVLQEENIDYIPLQYIIEYLKTKGKDGIIYQSSVSDGANLLFFNDKDFILKNSKLYDITRVEYIFEEIK
jgi:hypothetical protein